MERLLKHLLEQSIGQDGKNQLVGFEKQLNNAKNKLVWRNGSATDL